jgi:alpha-ketoglutarate-dependent taurine dioxygenase
MIKIFEKNSLNENSLIKLIKKSWKNEKNKVFFLKRRNEISDVRNYYEKLSNQIGSLKKFAEDVRLGDRYNQKANKIWMEIRYDSKIKNAYRHSQEPQPLHTDGSYVEKFPNSSIMCCISNSAIGGETIFLDLKKLIKIMKKDQPKLLKFLFKKVILFERSGYKKKSRILSIKNKKLKVNFNYYCVSKNNSKESLKNIENFFQFLNTSKKIVKSLQPVKLNKGDAVFWKDDEVLHGRNGFFPKKESDRFLWKAAIDIGE